VDSNAAKLTPTGLAMPGVAGDAVGFDRLVPPDEDSVKRAAGHGHRRAARREERPATRYQQRCLLTQPIGQPVGVVADDGWRKRLASRVRSWRLNPLGGPGATMTFST
jgi:hypothetical protein